MMRPTVTANIERGAFAVVLCASPVIAMSQDFKAMLVAKRADVEIVLTQTFAASPDRVFRALTNPGDITQWMQTGPFKLVECDIDLRVGGALRFRYQRSGGPTIEVRGIYESVDAPHAIRYAESYDFSPLTLTVSVRLVESNGGTMFTQTIRYRTEQERDADFPNIASSSPNAYARLQTFLTESAAR